MELVMNQFEQCAVSVTKRAVCVLTSRSKVLAGPLRDNIGTYVVEEVRKALDAMTERSLPDEEELLRTVCKAAWQKMRDDAGNGEAH